MRKIKEALRLHFELGLSNRKIGNCLGATHSAIGDYLTRAATAGLGWPLPESLSDAQLEQRLFPPVSRASATKHPLVLVHRELENPAV